MSVDSISTLVVEWKGGCCHAKNVEKIESELVKMVGVFTIHSRIRAASGNFCRNRRTHEGLLFRCLSTVFVCALCLRQLPAECRAPRIGLAELQFLERSNDLTKTESWRFADVQLHRDLLQSYAAPPSSWRVKPGTTRSSSQATPGVFSPESWEL